MKNRWIVRVGLLAVILLVIGLFAAPVFAMADDAGQAKDAGAATLQMAGIGLVLGWISKWFHGWWNRKKVGVEEYGTTIDDRAGAWFEEKTGFRVPKLVHDVWDAAIHTGVQGADLLASKEVLCRDVLRAIIAKDPSRAAPLLDEFSKIDWTGNFMANLSPELKSFFNIEKKAVAMNIAQAGINKSVAIHNGDLSAAIDAAATANKTEKISKAVAMTPAVAAKLVEEHKKLLELAKPCEEEVTEEMLLQKLAECRARKAAYAAASIKPLAVTQ